MVIIYYDSLTLFIDVSGVSCFNEVLNEMARDVKRTLRIGGTTIVACTENGCQTMPFTVASGRSKHGLVELEKS